MYEEDPETLLKDMAARRVLVEINLTSNEDVLGVSGKNHPFPVYRKFGVPVALSTDDEGIERIDLTREYVRAVESYGLSYADLKQLACHRLEYSFLSGVSLWAGPDFARLADACGGDVAGADKASSASETFLKGSEKAEQQWELEKRFQAFEGGF
jgi:adenosine deaminase